MRSDAVATVESGDWTSSIYRVTRRPSATFLVLELVSGELRNPGFYIGEVELDGVRVPCAITVLDEPRAHELWCQPRGPIPRPVDGDEAILRFGATGAGHR
jgi:hypothetical protein